MIYVDRRAGSAELWPLLTAAGLPAEIATLDFGDLALIGHGPESAVTIGVERKTIRDLAQSLTSGRLSGHQVPGLVKAYDYRWIVVEGSYRPDDHGRVSVPGYRKGGRGNGNGNGNGWDSLGLRCTALDGYLLTLTLRAGIFVQRTYSVAETVSWVGALHQWWTGKAWADHRAHLALHQPEPDQRLWVAPNTVQKVAACLPGVGAEKSAAVGQRFRSVLELALADEKTWRTVPGIGPVIAKRVVRVLQEGD